MALHWDQVPSLAIATGISILNHISAILSASSGDIKYLPRYETLHPIDSRGSLVDIPQLILQVLVGPLMDGRPVLCTSVLYICYLPGVDVLDTIQTWATFHEHPSLVALSEILPLLHVRAIIKPSSSDLKNLTVSPDWREGIPSARQKVVCTVTFTVYAGCSAQERAGCRCPPDRRRLSVSCVAGPSVLFHCRS